MSEGVAEDGGYTVPQDIQTKINELRESKDALQNLIKVEKVNTINVHPKKKRVGRYTGMTNKYKKAIVTLANGNKIDF